MLALPALPAPVCDPLPWSAGPFLHVCQTGNGLAAEVSRWRIAANDRPNAEQIETTRCRAALVVPGNLPLAAAE